MPKLRLDRVSRFCDSGLVRRLLLPKLQRGKLPTRHIKVVSAMKVRMTWPELCRSGRFTGLWVALDNCRYDQATRQPLEGDLVDADEDLAILCGRMREKGRSSCTILYCEDEVLVESRRTPTPPASLRTIAD